MQSCNTRNGVSLLGGALLGAAAMYFLDPEKGPDRRHHAAGAAGGAWDKAKGWGAGLAGAASSAAASVAGHASDTWESARDSRAAERVRDGASWLGHKAADAGHGAWDAISGWGGSAADATREGTRSLRHRLARAIDSEEETSTGTHVAGYTATALGTLAVGAALMYYMDPQQGRRRRAECGAKLSSIVRRTGASFHRTGRHWMNKLRGKTHEARHLISHGGDDDDVTGEQLLQRCRSEIGHVISRPADVQLMADAGGVVTVYGSCGADETDRLMSTLGGVRGVSRVVNRLEQGTTGGTAGTGSYATSMPATGGTAGAAQI